MIQNWNNPRYCCTKAARFQIMNWRYIIAELKQTNKNSAKDLHENTGFIRISQISYLSAKAGANIRNWKPRSDINRLLKSAQPQITESSFTDNSISQREENIYTTILKDHYPKFKIPLEWLLRKIKLVFFGNRWTDHDHHTKNINCQIIFGGTPWLKGLSQPPDTPATPSTSSLWRGLKTMHVCSPVISFCKMAPENKCKKQLIFATSSEVTGRNVLSEPYRGASQNDNW